MNLGLIRTIKGYFAGFGPDLDHFRPILRAIGLIWTMDFDHFKPILRTTGHFDHFKAILRALDLDLATFRGF